MCAGQCRMDLSSKAVIAANSEQDRQYMRLPPVTSIEWCADEHKTSNGTGGTTVVMNVIIFETTMKCTAPPHRQLDRRPGNTDKIKERIHDS